MDDGTKIAVEIYLPKSTRSGEKVPVMYEQSRYWRVIEPRFPFNLIYRKPLSLYRYEFLSHGYAWIVSDARGAGASFGNRPWELPPIDISDSKQIMDWIVDQPWSNGKIGLIGHSYSGNMAEFSLLNKHPSVKAAAVLSSSFDLYTDILRPGGLPLQPFIDQWMDLNKHFDSNRLPANLQYLRLVLRNMKSVDEDKDHYLLKEALAEHKENTSLDSDKIKFRDDIVLLDNEKQTAVYKKCLDILKSRFGDDFLGRGVDLSSPSGYWKEIDAAGVPIYACAGWLDGANPNAAIKRYLNYTTPGTKLILGPWDHDFFNISPFTRGGLSRFRVDREMLKFFDHYLRGVDSLANELPVHYFTLGEERWHESDTWPPNNTPLVLYLANEHKLAPDRLGTESSVHYKVNANTGTGHKGRWDCLLGNVLFDPYPNRKDQDKHLLVFDTSPLTSGLTVSGNPSLTAFVKTTNGDCSLFAYLEDVWPNGSVHYVSEGEILSGNRFDSDATPMYKTVLPARTFKARDYHALESEKIVTVDLELLPISYLFKVGHRIRLAIAGKDKDHFRAPAFTATLDEFDLKIGNSCQSRLSLPVSVETTQPRASHKFVDKDEKLGYHDSVIGRVRTAVPEGMKE